MLFSIITINFNNADGLRKTLESVRSQTSKNYEHIIVDGGSTDGSVDVIHEFLQDEEYAEHVTFWCSEKDGGIWDAMNKGVSHANGQYVLMLNSGDNLNNKDVISYLNSLSFTQDIIYSNTNCITSSGNYIVKYPEKLSPEYFKGGMSLGHQNALISTEISRKFPYHLDYKYASDIVFFIETIIVNGCSTKYIDFCIADFDAETGCSSVEETKEARFDEWIRIWQTYFPGKLYQDYLKLNDYEYAYRGICRRIMSFIKKIRGNHK